MFFKTKRTHYESIYKSAYRAFFVLCLRYCGSQQEAEEAFNDGMVKYFEFEKKNTIEEATRYALIKKILINTCIDRSRKKKLSFQMIDEAISNQYSEPAQVDYQQVKEEILVLIQQLPPQTRLVFNLYIFEGWSHKKIADHLQITENTSYWHLNKGKEKVLSILIES